MMDIQTFSDLFDIGLHPLPLKWNTETKQAEVYPEHITDVRSGNGKHDLNDVKRWLSNIVGANGIALKLHPPFFMFDFDLKNSEDKGVYNDWLNIIEATNPDVLRKLCIEKTRSGGFHVYAKYPGVTHKKMLASSEQGREIISIYTGGLLSFCFPTPGYELIHNDFSDIQELTTEEFDLLVSCAIHFNKYQPKDNEYIPGEIIQYPIEYESVALQFDKKCSDELFESLLNAIDLYKTNKRPKVLNGFTYYYYLRKGSTSGFSAKVCFQSKRLFIFSASFQKFPNFHTRIDDKDKSWRLTPTRLLYYIYDKDWSKAIDQIKILCNEFGIEITEPKQPDARVLPEDRLRFPYDIFPEEIQQYIQYQPIQHEYIAAACLGSLSVAIGNSAVLQAMPGYVVKPILYLAIVAPPGASKTPAISKAFAPIEEYDNILFEEYSKAMDDYKERLAEYEKDKKNNEKPEQPAFPQLLIKDFTIEVAIKILSHNKNGCCVLADELVGFLNRMNQYKSGDEVQKWLEMWSGNQILLQRITREVNKVKDPFCSIVGGIQPGVLESLSRDENQHNGFYHRFLFCYPEPQDKIDWQQIIIPDTIKNQFYSVFRTLLRLRTEGRTVYFFNSESGEMYKKWFDKKNKYYNRAIDDNIKGIIAKYQDYCLRFALLIQVVRDGQQRQGVISGSSMEAAIRLTEYFLGNMNKAIKVLAPETPADKLQGKWKQLFDQLPENFSTRTIVTMAVTLGLKEAQTKVFLGRQEGKLFRRIGRGEYEKIF